MTIYLNRKEIVRFILFIIFIFLICMDLTPNRALAFEETYFTREVPDTLNLKFYFPSTLNNYNFILKNELGETVNKGEIDKNGHYFLTLPLESNDFVITVNTSELTPQFEDKRRFRLEELAMIVFVFSVISAIVFFYLGRRSNLGILKELREVLYDEDLD